MQFPPRESAVALAAEPRVPKLSKEVGGVSVLIESSDSRQYSGVDAKVVHEVSAAYRGT